MQQELIRGERHRPWQEALIAFAILLLTLPFVYTLSKNGFDSHHTGLMYKGALDVASGKALFRETFTQYGALTTYIQALFLLIFGKRVTSILLATALFYALDFLLLYRISRRFLCRTLSLVGTGITVFLAPFYFENWFFHPWSSVFAITFLLLSLDLLLLGFEKSGRAALLFATLSGVSATLAFWCRQPVGLVTILAGVLCLSFLAIFKKDERRHLLLQLALFLIGAVIGVLLLLIPIIATNATEDFLRQSLGGMLTFASDRSNTDDAGVGGLLSHLFYSLVTSPFYNAYDIWIDPVWALLPLAALVMALGVAVRIILTARKQQEITPRDVLLLAFGIYAVANWHQYYPVPCYRHWFWGAFLCVPVALLFLQWGLGKLSTLPRLSFLKKPRIAPLMLALAILIVFGGNVGVRAVHAIRSAVDMNEYGKFEHPVYEHLNGLSMNPEMHEHYTVLLDSVALLEERFPDANIINTTGNGIYAVFGENFCPLFNNSGDYFYEEYPMWLADYIAAEHPIVIGPEAPEEYVLYLEIPGDGGDEFAASHDMPANIYLPAELAALIP